MNVRRPALVLASLVILNLACSASVERTGGAAADAVSSGGGAASHASAAVERGKYLVTVLACSDCHTPLKMTGDGPVPDEALAFAGHPAGLVMPPAPALPQGPWMWVGAGTNTAFSGPWGISYSPNLTPDEVTGIGSWTEEIFVNTMRTGKHWGQSRPILPPMPWPAYSKMTDDDLKAVFAYLRSVPPITNQAPDSIPAAPPAAAGEPAAAPAAGR